MSPPLAQWTNFSLSVHIEFASLVELILNNQAPRTTWKKNTYLSAAAVQHGT